MPKLDYKDKITRHRMTRVARYCMAVVIVLAVILLIKIQFDNKIYTEAEVVNTVDKMGTEDSVFLCYQNKILTYSNDGVSTYDAKGNQIWNKTYEMQNPIVKINGEYVAASDYKGSMIYIMNGSGPISEIDTNMPIMNLALSNHGVIAATLQDDDVTWVNLYASDGTQISTVKTSMQKSGYPLATTISADNVKLGISYLKAQSGGVNTSVAFYNFGDVGQNNTDHLVSGKDYTDTIIPLLTYVDDENAIAASQTSLMIFKGKEKPALDKTIDFEQEIQGIFYNNKYIGVVFHNTESNDPYRLEVYGMDGNKKYSSIIGFEYENIIFQGDNCIIYADSNVLILRGNGRVKFNGDLGGSISALLTTDSKTKFIVVRGDKIETVKLH